MDGLSSNTLIFNVEIEEIMILSCLKSKVLSMVWIRGTGGRSQGVLREEFVGRSVQHLQSLRLLRD